MYDKNYNFNGLQILLLKKRFCSNFDIFFESPAEVNAC